MLLRLDPPVQVETPLGPGDAIIYEDDGEDMYWTVVLRESRAFVQFRNRSIRAAKCFTLGRGIDDETMRKIIA